MNEENTMRFKENMLNLQRLAKALTELGYEDIKINEGSVSVKRDRRRRYKRQVIDLWFHLGLSNNEYVQIRKDRERERFSLHRYFDVKSWEWIRTVDPKEVPFRIPQGCSRSKVKRGGGVRRYKPDPQRFSTSNAPHGASREPNLKA